MTRQIDFDKPLSDEDKQWALDRGLTLQVQDNEAKFTQDEDGDRRYDTGQTFGIQNNFGLNGNEPSATSDRTTPTGVGLAQVELRSSGSFQEAEEAGVQESGEGTAVPAEGGQGIDSDAAGEYEEWTVPQLQDELGKRELSKSGNKAELVARLTADDSEDGA